jgi:hypothetical protein
MALYLYLMKIVNLLELDVVTQLAIIKKLASFALQVKVLVTLQKRVLELPLIVQLMCCTILLQFVGHQLTLLAIVM